MTKYEDRTHDDAIDGLGANLASDLHDLYSAPLPALRFQRSSANVRTDWFSLWPRRSWRPAAVLVATATAVAAVLVGPSLWSVESQVNAETIFARTSAAAQSSAPAVGQQSYHLVATNESAGQASASTSEVWYLDATHLRNEQEWDGDTTPDFGITVNGSEAWMYGDFSGVDRAVHGPASELGTSFADQSHGSNIGEVLSQYSGNCQKAQQNGEETIAGRAAYRIVVTLDVEACPTIGSEPGKDIGKLGTLIVLVDKETFLPLKTEQRGDGGLPAYTYTVISIQVGEDISDATFAYTAPPGVTIQEVTDVTAAKNVLSGYTSDGTAPAP